MQILILGCGVNGLSCGIRLLEAGFGVTIRARERTPHTTSDVAAAVFYPYRAEPQPRVLGWCRVALGEFRRLVLEPGTGVSWLDMLELFEQPVADPWWKEMLPDFRRVRPDELSAGFVDGYAFETIRVEMPVYMRWMEHRFLEGGGSIDNDDITDVAALAAEHPLIVNCTGLGARQVAHDDSVFPIRGQIVRVRNVGISRCTMHDPSPSELSYVVPRRHDVVLGGSATDNDWNMEPDPEVEQRLLQRCTRLEPRLESPEVVSRAVGLRPGRREVRLDVERLSATCSIIHDYGHGGSGVTLSWGCAAEVLQHAREEAARLASGD